MFTLSRYSFSFLISLKRAFGRYVTLLYLEKLKHTLRDRPGFGTYLAGGRVGSKQHCLKLNFFWSFFTIFLHWYKKDNKKVKKSLYLEQPIVPLFWTPVYLKGVPRNHLCLFSVVRPSVRFWILQRPVISCFPKLCMKLGVNKIKKVTWP